jgi:hypothetical protein
LLLFKEWLRHADGVDPEATAMPVLPLHLFQPNDPKQLGRLFDLVHRSPHVIYHWLIQHVFPSTMNFQSLKISACGHELGSSILFGSRIGFSGTPSNLLPLDLGDCQYEPGSDVSAESKPDWSAQSLLQDVASATPPAHALIDTGALITGMDNEEVAQFLLQRLPPAMEGVVYLDRNDRQMILLRASGRSTSLAQCGIPPAQRFTFYDQIHTTGMDIKQAPSAKAIVTIGKAMTFRDYAQGTFRMRGIGKGQSIVLYLTPEAPRPCPRLLLWTYITRAASHRPDLASIRLARRSIGSRHGLPNPNRNPNPNSNPRWSIASRMISQLPQGGRRWTSLPGSW